jgi:lipopolysaccharide/colanic/teichoic acid biosynthesis glycosyltransferase
LEDIPVAQRGYQRIAALCRHSRTALKAVGGAKETISEVVWWGSLHGNRFRRAAKQPDTYSDLLQTGSIRKQILRREFDIVCALAGLVILAPLFALISLAVKLEDGGPVFYFHLRVGKGLRKFRLIKFRSMFSNCAGGPLTAPQDARVTRVGRFLRKYKLDELPQLVNILKGEMQLVGVRPQVERFVDIFPLEYGLLLQTPPGITDLASLTFRNEERLFQGKSIEELYIAKILPIKLEMALKYSRTRTFLSDLEIIFRTVLGFQSPSKAWEGTRFDPSVQSLAEFLSRNSS